MSSSLPIRHQDLDRIVQECCAEAHQQRATESGYCYELFRRALDEQDHDAWQAIEQQYRQLVYRWIIGATAATPLPAEEADDLAQDALVKFWRALTGRAEPLERRFPHVGALLNFLRQCARTAVIDHQRQQQRRAQLHQTLAVAEQHLHTITAPFTAEVEDRDLVRRVCSWIATHITDPTERLVIDLRYRVDMKPAEIAARYPALFADAKAVEQVRERVLKRLRRALESATVAEQR